MHLTERITVTSYLTYCTYYNLCIFLKKLIIIMIFYDYELFLNGSLGSNLHYNI